MSHHLDAATLARIAADPTTDRDVLTRMATGDPGRPHNRIARLNPSLPTSVIVSYLKAHDPLIWANPAVEWLPLQGVEVPTELAMWTLCRIFDQTEPTPPSRFLRTTLQAWWMHDATVERVVDLFYRVLIRRQARPGWFARQEHLEMIEVMGLCLLNNPHRQVEVGVVRKVLQRIKHKKYRIKGLGDGFSPFVLLSVGLLVAMAKGDNNPRERPTGGLDGFVEGMHRPGCWMKKGNILVNPHLIDPDDEAAMLKALRQRWPTFPLLRLVPDQEQMALPGVD